MASRAETRTGGRPATTGVIPGNHSLSVGNPETPLPQGWRWTPLTDVARLESGHTPSRKHPEWWDGDVPWIGIRDATDNHGRTIGDTYQHTNELGIANSSARILPKHTVCLSRTASVGYVVVMGRAMATSQDFVNWVCSEALDYRFLKYVLLAEREAFLRFASGTTHQTIYFPEVKAFHVALPPVPEQNAIGRILSGLDDRIEINRRMNDNLEGIARALFKSWFVDFDPVRAKACEQNTGLPDSIAALFPNSLGPTEQGDIPQGWRLRSIGELANVSGGSTPSTKEPTYWDDGTHWWATPKDLSMLVTPVLLGTERKITDAGLSQISSGLLPKGTVLMSSRAPIGYLAVAEFPVAINQGFIAMQPMAGVSNLFLLRWAEWAHETIISRANGSTFLEISKSNFRPILVVTPPEPLMKEFDRIARPLYERMVLNEQTTRTLIELRDSLLPKLISGELRVPDVERIVGAELE
jgi:type I restriction enzyme S subunit